MQRLVLLTLALTVFSGGCQPMATEPAANVPFNWSPPPPLSAFDPKNPQDDFQMVRWLRSIWKEYDDAKADGNPVQIAEALQNVSDKLEQLRGAKIRWVFHVTALGNDGQRDYLDISASDSLPTEFKFKTATMVEPATVARFYSGNDLTPEHYKTLINHSPVTLEATLGGDFIHHRIFFDKMTIVDAKSQ